MRTSRTILPTACLLVLAMLAGCAQSRPRKLAMAEPLYSADPGADPVVIQAPRARVVTFADRHPLLTRPREYYDTTQGTKLRKTAAAAVLGLPSGMGAEIRQVVVGRPPGM